MADTWRHKVDHLWTSAIAEVTLTRAELRAFLLDSGGSIIRSGHLCDVKAQHLGAGVYRVTAARRPYGKEAARG